MSATGSGVSLIAGRDQFNIGPVNIPIGQSLTFTHRLNRRAYQIVVTDGVDGFHFSDTDVTVSQTTNAVHLVNNTAGAVTVFAAIRWADLSETVDLIRSTDSRIVVTAGAGCAAFTPGTELNPFNGDVSLDSDAAIALFAANGFDAVIGNLTIQEAAPGGITSLAGLESLRYVSRSLVVANNTVLSSLTPLGNLARVGSGVYSLGEGRFELGSMPFITSVVFLNLHNIDGNLYIHDMPVTTLNMECLSAVLGAFRLENLNIATLASKFAHLVTAGTPYDDAQQGIMIKGNLLLTSIAGMFPVLVGSVSEIVIDGNTALTTMVSFAALLPNAYQLGVYDNTSLVGFDSRALNSWVDAVDVGHQMYIEFFNNGALNLAGAFPALIGTHLDYIAINDKCASLTSAFPVLTRFQYFEVIDCVGLTAITNVCPLVTHVEKLVGGIGNGNNDGYIYISGNPVLTGFTTAWKLVTRFDRLEILDNPLLLSTAGLLPALTTLIPTAGAATGQGRLNIDNNDSLTSIASLGSITGIGHSLLVRNNALLAAVATLSSVNGGSFNPGLTSLVAFNNNPALSSAGQIVPLIAGYVVQGYTGSTSNTGNAP